MCHYHFDLLEIVALAIAHPPQKNHAPEDYPTRPPSTHPPTEKIMVRNDVNNP